MGDGSVKNRFLHALLVVIPPIVSLYPEGYEMLRFSIDEFPDWLHTSLIPKAVIDLYPAFIKVAGVRNQVVKIRLGANSTINGRAYFIMALGNTVFVHRVPEHQRALMGARSAEVNLKVIPFRDEYALYQDRPPICLGQVHVYNIDSDSSSVNTESPMAVSVDVASAPKSTGVLGLQLCYFFENPVYNSVNPASIDLNQLSGVIRVSLPAITYPDSLRESGLQPVGLIAALVYRENAQSAFQRASTYGSGFMMARCLSNEFE